MSPLSFPHGFYAGEWQKSPVPFGASAGITRAWQQANLPAAATDILDSVVPAGEAWVITNFVMLYSGTPPANMYAQIIIGGVTSSVFVVSPPTSLITYDRQGWWVLFPGDRLNVHVATPTLGDYAEGRAIGFRIDIDQ